MEKTAIRILVLENFIDFQILTSKTVNKSLLEDLFIEVIFNKCLLEYGVIEKVKFRKLHINTSSRS